MKTILTLLTLSAIVLTGATHSEASAHNKAKHRVTAHSKAVKTGHQLSKTAKVKKVNCVPCPDKSCPECPPCKDCP